MHSIPSGISRLDQLLGGGLVPGSVILLAGEAGAGAREFGYTSVTMNALAKTAPAEFELYYGDSVSADRLPDTVAYISLTTDRATLRRERESLMDDGLAAASMDALEVFDLSPAFFEQSSIPTGWCPTDTVFDTTNTENSGADSPFTVRTADDILETLGATVERQPARSLVVIDSVTDLLALDQDQSIATELSIFVRGVQQIARERNSVVLLHGSLDALSSHQVGHLKAATTATFRFEWVTGGTERNRTLVIEQYRGVLSRVDDEAVNRFETEMHDGGFDITSVHSIT